MQMTVLCILVVRLILAQGSLPPTCQPLSCLAGDFSVRGLFPIYTQNNTGESGSLKRELRVRGGKQCVLRRTHYNLETFQRTKVGSSQS